MKKICITFLVIIIIIVMAFCQVKDEDEYLRIHVRANSDDVYDQMVKMEVRDALVLYLTPIIENASSRDEVLSSIQKEVKTLSLLSKAVLEKNGFSYGATVELKRESVPTRVYENVTLEAGEYETIVVELGDGKGDNWWCVVYPPLCFSGEKVRYKSYLYEVVKRFL